MIYFSYLIPILVVFILTLRQRMVIQAFLRTETITSGTAKTLDILGLSSSLFFRSLLKRKIIMECGQDQYYLDEVNLQTYKKLRVKVVIILCMTILVALILINIIASYWN